MAAAANSSVNREDAIPDDLVEYCTDVAQCAKMAAGQLAVTRGDVKNAWLRRAACLLRERGAQLQAANTRDLEAAPGYGLTEAQTDRLRLTPERVEGIAVGLEEVAALPEPIGRVIDSSVQPSGLEISKVRVPLGVVFFI